MHLQSQLRVVAMEVARHGMCYVRFLEDENAESVDPLPPVEQKIETHAIDICSNGSRP
jgi:hypothetical protein